MVHEDLGGRVPGSERARDAVPDDEEHLGDVGGREMLERVVMTGREHDELAVATRACRTVGRNHRIAIRERPDPPARPVAVAAAGPHELPTCLALVPFAEGTAVIVRGRRRDAHLVLLEASRDRAGSVRTRLGHEDRVPGDGVVTEFWDQSSLLDRDAYPPVREP